MLPKTNREVLNAKRSKGRESPRALRVRAQENLARAAKGMPSMQLRMRNTPGRAFLIMVPAAGRRLLPYTTRRAAHFFP